MPDSLNPLSDAEPGDTYLVTIPATGTTSKLVVIAFRGVSCVAWDYSIYTTVEDFPYDAPLWRDATYEKVTQ